VSGPSSSRPLDDALLRAPTRGAEARQRIEREREAAGRGARVALFILGGLAILVVHVVFGHEDFDVGTQMLAALLGVIALGALVRARPHSLPFGAYATTLIYIAYGFGTFSEADFHGAFGTIPLRVESFRLAALAAVVLSASILVAVPLGRMLGRRSAPLFLRGVPETVGPGFLVAAYVISAAVLLLHMATILRSEWVPPALAFPIHVVSRAALAQGLLLSAAQRSESHTPRRVAFAATAALSVIGISSGSLTPGLLPWVSLAMLLWVLEGQVPWRGALLVFALLLVLNPAKAAFRDIVWFGRGSTEFDLTERFGIWQQVLVRTWSGESTDTSRNLETTADRVSLLAYAAQSIEWVPSPVSESGFERWLNIPSAYVPRLLWADKPDLTIENNVAYTRAFGLQTSDGARRTTLAFPILADGYWTARFPGVALAGVLLGLLYGFLSGLVVKGRWATLVLGTTLLSTITPTTHLGSSFTGVPQMILGALAVMWAAVVLSRLLAPAQVARATREARV